jgi:hypothetical protein
MQPSACCAVSASKLLKPAVHHTGAFSSVRLCVGPELARCVHFLMPLVSGISFETN